MAINDCSKCGGPKDGTHKCYCRACFAAYVRARHVPKPRKRPSQDEIQANARARGRRHYARHAKEIRARRAANREAINKRRSELHAQRSDEERITRHRRAWQARKAVLRGVPFVEYTDPLVVLEMDDGVCGICGEDVDPFRFELDHIVPTSRGGEFSYANVQVAHPTCNRQKFVKVLAWP